MGTRGVFSAHTVEATDGTNFMQLTSGITGLGNPTNPNGNMMVTSTGGIGIVRETDNISTTYPFISITPDGVFLRGTSATNDPVGWYRDTGGSGNGVLRLFSSSGMPVSVDSSNYLLSLKSGRARYYYTSSPPSTTLEGAIRLTGGLYVENATAAAYSTTVSPFYEDMTGSIVTRGGICALGNAIFVNGGVSVLSTNDSADTPPSISTPGGVLVPKSLWVGPGTPVAPPDFASSAFTLSSPLTSPANGPYFVLTSVQAGATTHLMRTYLPGIEFRVYGGAAWGVFAQETVACKGLGPTNTTGDAGLRCIGTGWQGALELFGSEGDSATLTAASMPVNISRNCPFYTPAFANTATLTATLRPPLVSTDCGTVQREARTDTTAVSNVGTMFRIMTLTDYAVGVDVQVTWVKADKSASGYCQILQRAINNSGTVTLGTVGMMLVDPSNTPTTTPIQISISGTDLLVQVTGDSTSIVWVGRVCATHVSVN